MRGVPRQTKWVTFSVGIDAIVLGKSFQYSNQLGTCWGWCIQIIVLTGKSIEEIQPALKDCIDG
jgi:hypothetical protein